MAKEMTGALGAGETTRDYIAESMAEAICVTGMNGEVLFLNTAAGKLFRTGGEKRRRKIWCGCQRTGNTQPCGRRRSSLFFRICG